MMLLLLRLLLLHPTAPYYLLRHVCMFCFFHIRGRRSSSAQIFVQELKFGWDGLVVDYIRFASSSLDSMT